MARLRLLVVLAVAASGLVVVPASLATPTDCAVDRDRLRGSGEVARTALTRPELETTAATTTMIDNSAFALPAEAAPAEHTFEGRLSFGGQANGTHYEAWDTPAPEFLYPDLQQLPSIALDFVQSCSYLIPVQRG
jgi:hypothetical protein